MGSVRVGLVDEVLDELTVDVAGAPDRIDAAAHERILEAFADRLAALPPAELAARIVAGTWRPSMEMVHGPGFGGARLHDGQMAWANIKMTFDIEPLCQDGVPDECDVLELYADPHRELLPRRGAGDVVGALWDDILEGACADLSSMVTYAAAPLRLAGWWASPSYARRVSRFAAAADAERWGDTGQLASRLLYSPLSLDPDEWLDVVTDPVWISSRE